MNKKMTYEAPVTEQMYIRFEQNFLDSTKSASGVANITGSNIIGGEQGEDW